MTPVPQALALTTAALVLVTLPLTVRAPEAALPLTVLAALFWAGAGWRSRNLTA